MHYDEEDLAHTSLTPDVELEVVYKIYQPQGQRSPLNSVGPDGFALAQKVHEMLTLLPCDDLSNASKPEKSIHFCILPLT